MTDPDPYRPDPANDADAAEALAEVLSLAAALADRVRTARASGEAIPEEHTTALVKAARLLRERGVDWPPALAQVLRELEEGVREVEPAEDGPRAGDGRDEAAGRMARLLGALRWGTVRP